MDRKLGDPSEHNKYILKKMARGSPRKHDLGYIVQCSKNVRMIDDKSLIIVDIIWGLVQRLDDAAEGPHTFFECCHR